MNISGGNGWSADTGSLDGEPIWKIRHHGRLVAVLVDNGDEQLTTTDVCCRMVELERGD